MSDRVGWSISLHERIIWMKGEATRATVWDNKSYFCSTAARNCHGSEKSKRSGSECVPIPGTSLESPQVLNCHVDSMAQFQKKMDYASFIKQRIRCL